MKPTYSTLVYTKPSPYTTARVAKVKKYDTFLATARYFLDRGYRDFTASAIVVALREQGYVARLSDVREYLHFNGITPELKQVYTYWVLEELAGESYHWELYEFDPAREADFQTRIVYSGTRGEKATRLDCIKVDLVMKVKELTLDAQRRLLYEAMSLAIDLGHEGAWHTFRRLLDRIKIPVRYNLEHGGGRVDPGKEGLVYAMTPAAAVTELERRHVKGTVARIQLVEYDGQPTGWF
jgi:hypothetical protein